MGKFELIYPNYYKKFRCIAGDCRDNCCIGWEIDVDGDTLRKYEKIGGDFGARLEKSIENGSFVLNGERCPFLNGDNLCDIIINLGEDSLCSICAHHPRFVEQFGTRTEIGLGLSCQTAAELILSADLSGYLVRSFTDDEAEIYGFCDNDDDTDMLAYLTELRDNIFALISGASSVYDFAAPILSFCGGSPSPAGETESAAYFSDVCRFLCALEPVDDNWRRLISAVSDAPYINAEYDTALCKSLAHYFVYRYLLTALFDGNVEEKLLFSMFSMAFCGYIVQLNGGGHLGGRYTAAELCALYSKQIEYSGENMSLVFEHCRYNGLFSADNLFRLM